VSSVRDSSSLPLPDFICEDGTRLSVRVRFSPKARRWRLSLGFQGTLELVLPERQRRRYSLSGEGIPSVRTERELTAFVEERRLWIQRAARRTRAQRESYAESKTAGLPTHLDFPLARELWLLEYQQTESDTVTARARASTQTLRIFGAVGNEQLCCHALVRFTTRHAKEVIPPFAWEIAHEVGAKPQSITVNNRKSAWGLCTAAGDIKIDRRVLFFPEDMARQIVLHELAHLRHMDHSQRFYDALFSYNDSSKEAEHSVKQGIRFVPAWFIDGVR
jgi:predicted metal-dependent hydrolase